MNRRLESVAIGVMLLGLGATPAAAQLQGLPVYFNPKGGTGLTISGDFGREVSTKQGPNTAPQKPNGLGVSARLGLPVVSVGVGAAVYDPNVITQNNELQYAGTVAVKVFGSPLVPVAVSLQAGAGYLRVGSGTFATKTVNIPIGLGVALNVPTPGASIEPWLAGRVHLSSVSIGTVAGGSISSTRVGYGASGGLSVGLSIGLGFHVALDWATFGAQASSPFNDHREQTQRLTAGVGAHFTLKIPGLGVPLVPGI
jgi:hypothetical protein